MDDERETQVEDEIDDEIDDSAADEVTQDLSSEDLSSEDLEDADLDAEVDDVLVLEEVEQELVLAVWEPTGEPRVDAALDLLATLDPDDVHQHAAVFDDIHQQLRATLTDLDTATS